MGMRATCSLPPAIWDGLAGSQVTAQHGFLTAVEAAGIPGLVPHYLALPGGAGGAFHCQLLEPVTQAVMDQFLCFLQGTVFDIGDPVVDGGCLELATAYQRVARMLPRDNH